jgi:acyl-coenzyme A synthetase/AMP-(fatty) acid ligase
MRRLRRIAGEALYLGLLAEGLAPTTGRTPITVDQPLALFPQAGTALSVAGMAEFVDDLAGRLHAAGVRPGERVAVFRSYSFDSVLLACAIARLGAVPALLSHRLDADTVLALLGQLDRPRLLTDAAMATGTLAGTALADRLAGPLISTDELPDGLPNDLPHGLPGAVSLAELAGAARRPAVRPDPAAPALITHTSGTTDVPKLCVQSSRSLYGQVPQQARLLRIVFYGREEMVQCVSMLHARMYSGLALYSSAGIPATYLSDPDPARVAQVLRERRPGGLESHPNILIRWEELATHPDAPLSSVKLFINGFDAVHPRTVRTMLGASRRRFPIYALGYGQTEIGLVTGRLYTRRSAQKADFRCVGRPFSPLTRVRVTPVNGRRSSPEQPGYIEARSSGRSLTYVAQEDRHVAQRQPGGWWRMGDLGYRTRFGCVHLLDREIDRGTGLPSNLAVEDQLLADLADLVEVVLVPGEGEPLPVVCTKGDRPLEHSAWQRATAQLPPLARPLHIRWEQMPITSTWKVRRPELRRRIEAGELTVLNAGADELAGSGSADDR